MWNAWQRGFGQRSTYPLPLKCLKKWLLRHLREIRQECQPELFQYIPQPDHRFNILTPSQIFWVYKVISPVNLFFLGLSCQIFGLFCYLLTFLKISRDSSPISSPNTVPPLVCSPGTRQADIAPKNALFLCPKSSLSLRLPGIAPIHENERSGALRQEVASLIAETALNNINFRLILSKPV